jgi:outer membrane protein assembly factor BamD (BamD/ComL family)
MMNRVTRCLLCLAAAAVLLPAAAGAQGPQPPAPPAKPRLKREPGWFRRAAAPTPAAEKERAEGLYRRGRLGAAARAYLSLVYTWPDAPEAVDAQFAYAQILETRRRYAKAFDEYQYLADHYAGRFDYARLLDRQFAIANHMMTARLWKLGPFPGFDRSDDAIPMFETLVQNAPAWEKAPQAQMNIARIHERNGRLEEAIAAFELLLTRYAGEAPAAEAAYHTGRCRYRLAGRRPNDRMAAESARAALIDFTRTHPRHAQADEARQYLHELDERLARMAFEQARYYDRVVRRPAAAIIAYGDFLKRYPASEKAPEARERLELLQQKAAREQTAP